MVQVPQIVQNAFDNFDKVHGTGDGTLTYSRMVAILKKLNPAASEILDRYIEHSGLQGSDSIEYNKFLLWLYGNATPCTPCEEVPPVKESLNILPDDMPNIDLTYLKKKNVPELMRKLCERILVMKPYDVEKFCADYFSGILAKEKRLVLISSDAGDVDALKAAVRPTGDMGAPIVTATWDFEESIDALTDLVRSLVHEHGTFKTVAVCCHGTSEKVFEEHESENWWMLTSSAGIELNSGRADSGVEEAIWTIAENCSVRVDLLACDLCGTAAGQEWLQHWEDKTKVNFAASTDVTGNEASGGNWVLETDGIDVSKVYFDQDKLKTWEDTLKRTGPVEKKKKKGGPAQLPEERMTTGDELWETINGLNTRLSLWDLACLFKEGFQSGFQEEFIREEPADPDVVVENMNTVRVVTAAREIEKNLNVPFDQLRQEVMGVPVKELKDATEMDKAWLKESISLFTFRKLLAHLEKMMSVSTQTFVSHLLWCHTRRFELTDGQFGHFKRALQVRRPTRHKPDSTSPVDYADFEQMMVEAGLIDEREKNGISKVTNMSAFLAVQKNMEKFIEARAKSHAGLNPKTHFKGQRDKSGRSAGILGRTEMSIFMEEFHKQWQIAKLFQSPLCVIGKLSDVEETPEEVQAKIAAATKDKTPESKAKYMEATHASSKAAAKKKK